MAIQPEAVRQPPEGSPAAAPWGFSLHFMAGMGLVEIIVDVTTCSLSTCLTSPAVPAFWHRPLLLNTVFFVAILSAFGSDPSPRYHA